MRFTKTVFLWTVVALLPLSARAADIDVGNSLNPGLSVGDTFQIVFVTSGTTQMNQLSNFVTPAQIADAFVQDAADNTPGSLLTGLGTWKAMASFDGYAAGTYVGIPHVGATQEHAKDRALVQGPVYRVDGLHVANDYADFWDGTHSLNGTILIGEGETWEEVVEDGAAINVTETGLKDQGQSWTWSGSTSDGTLKAPGGLFGECEGYPSEDGSAFGCGVGPAADATTIGFNNRWGSSTRFQAYPGDWMNANSPPALGGDNNLPFYALSEVITITGTILGDVDLSGVADLLDITPFVDRVANGPYQAEADTDENLVVDLLDIAPFVDILAGGVSAVSVVPEPSSLALLMVAGFFGLGRSKRS